MDIYFLTLILLVINRQIIDTQTQFSGILFFHDQQQDIQIWIRPWPQLFQAQKFDRQFPYAIINDKNGNEILGFSYIYFDQIISLFYKIQQEDFLIYEYEFRGSQEATWYKLLIHKSMEKIEYINFDNQKFPLSTMKLHQPNSIYSWLSLSFSCYIYDQIIPLNVNFLALQNDLFIGLQDQQNFNFRTLIIFIIYIKFQEIQKTFPLIKIQNEELQIYILLNLTNIMIDFDYGYNKSFSNAFDTNMINQWIQISLVNEFQQTLCQITFKDKFFQQNIPFQEKQDSIFDQSAPQQYTIVISQYLQNYKIYIINKFIESETVSIENFCYQNCKICNKLQCLECEGQLSIETNCLCPINQYLHLSLGFCVQKGLAQNIKINRNFVAIFCPFGFYYNQKNLKCAECPKLNEFYCTSCLYNLDHWQSHQYCFYQDIYQQMFIQPEVYGEFKRILTDPRKEKPFSSFQIEDQRLIIFYRTDIYRILFQLCEQNYFFDKMLKKCKILSKGQQSYQFKENNWKFCKIGYIYQKQCIKCQRNCLFCKLINHKLICILPKQTYTTGHNLQIIKCQDSTCQKIENQVFDECQIDNCMVCYFSACLVCNHNYVQDQYDICHLGSKFSGFHIIEINDNLIKPQYDYQQIFYLRFYLEKLKIDLQFYDIMQLILFSNNYKYVRKEKLPQQQNNYFQKDDQLVYCLNQTQYFNNRFCHQLVPGYQYIQQLDKYVYCYNQNCIFDLIFQVTVLFTNRPSIQYQNMSFLNFGFFAQSISTDELFIKNIIIQAVVFVFDSFLDYCEIEFFIMPDKKDYNYQLILDFQGVSVFPSCQKILNIDLFNQVQFKNLFTYSQIQLQFTCDNLLIINCTFLGQENFLLDIEASYIQLEQIYIEGILKEQVKDIIQLFHPQLIENIFITKFYVRNLTLFFINIIKLYQNVNQIKMEFIKLQNSILKKQSLFLMTKKQVILLTIEFLIIDNISLESSGLILLQAPPNLLTINNLLVQKSHIGSGSILIYAFSLKLFNITLTDLFIQFSRLIFVNENLIMQNIVFKQIQLSQTQILSDRLKFISVIRFSIIDSQIIQSQSLFQILANSFTFRFIYFLNCGYTPNIQLINIQGEAGIISSLMISNLTYVTHQEQHADYNYDQEIIKVNANQITIQWLYFVDLPNPQPILNIKYKKLQINKLYLKKIYFKQQQQEKLYVKQLISINSIENETSTCLIQIFRAQQIIIQIYSNFIEKSNNLIVLSLFGGQVNIIQSIIDNILSNIQMYIVKADQTLVRIMLACCIFRHLIVEFKYQFRVPLLRNDDQILNLEIILLPLKDLKLYNLCTPLIDIKSNSSLKILIDNLKIRKIILLDDIIKIEQIIPELGQVVIRQIDISDQLDNQQQFYFLNGSNLDVKIDLFSIKNIYMGIFQFRNNGKFFVKNFLIQNATVNQILFSFNNYFGDISFKQIIIRNLTQQDSIIIRIDFSNQSMSLKPYIIIDNLQINQYKGETFVEYIQNYQEHPKIALQEIIIEQSQFRNSIFQLNTRNQIKMDIQGLQIYKVDCGMFFFTPFNNILIKKGVIIDLYQRKIQGTSEIQFISSYLDQTNILNRQIDENITQNKIYDLYPIQLSFHENESFDILIKNKTYQVQYRQDSKIVYVPSGQQFMDFLYFNLQTLAHQQIYQTFSVLINSRIQNQQIICGFNQSIDGTYIGKYSNYYEFNLKAGLNTLDDFIFIMNPYQNYSYLQNDIICPNYTLRFDVRILLCQLGEYLYQNQCITCDINKNLYSIIKKAQYCQILNSELISKLKVGRVKLQKNYWRPSLTSNLIEKCEKDQVCLGGWMDGDLSCKSQRVGALCKECDIYNLKGEGQFAKSGQECLECQPNYLLILKGLSIFLWIIFITLMNYNTNQKITEKFLQFKIINRAYSDILMRQSIDQFSIIIKIYVNYFFIIYLVQENLQFLGNEILLGLNFISNPSTIVTTEFDCILVRLYHLDIQYIQLASSLISPIIILMIVFFIYVILLALRFQRYRFNLLVIITYSVYLFNQQIIIQKQYIPCILVKLNCSLTSQYQESNGFIVINNFNSILKNIFR
ncbi:hypothetical protein pb186bvf_011317 [Paramecium bursaria]